jgi:hypothetical protein
MPSKPYTGVNIDTMVLPSAYTTLQLTVGTSAVRLTATATPVCAMPVLKTDPANTGVVYLISSAAGTAATGVALGAGDGLPVPIDDLSKLWFIASAAGQKIAVVAGL